MSKIKDLSSQDEALYQYQQKITGIEVKLKSLGLLLSGHGVGETDLLHGIGDILVEMSDELSELANKLDPVELSKVSMRKTR